MKKIILAAMLLLVCASPAVAARRHLKPHATGVHPKNHQVHNHNHHHNRPA